VVDKRYSKRIRRELADVESHKALYGTFCDLTSSNGISESFGYLVSALTLPHWEPVRRAFTDTGLDPNDPSCWGALLQVFATIHYTPGAPGRKKYAPSYDEQFAQDLLKVSLGKVVGKSDLARSFLKSSVSKRDIYRSLKKAPGVRSAIRRLEQRQKMDWLSFAKVVIDNAALEAEGD
jgi:hypothetical protein